MENLSGKIRKGIPLFAAVHIVHPVRGTELPAQGDHILRLSQKGDNPVGPAPSGPCRNRTQAQGIIYNTMHQADGLPRYAHGMFASRHHYQCQSY